MLKVGEVDMFEVEGWIVKKYERTNGGIQLILAQPLKNKQLLLDIEPSDNEGGITIYHQGTYLSIHEETKMLQHIIDIWKAHPAYRLRFATGELNEQIKTIDHTSFF